MTALDGLGGVATTAMQPRAYMTGERDEHGRCFHIRLVMVSNNCLGRHVRTCERLAKKRLCTGPVTFVPQQHINDLPVLVDGPIYVEFLCTAKAEHFIHRPVPPDPPSVLAERGG